MGTGSGLVKPPGGDDVGNDVPFAKGSAQEVAERNSKVGMRPQVGADSSFMVRARGLARLGLIESEDATIDPPWNNNCQPGQQNCTQAYLWMIHGITHGLGLAVHDPIQASFGDRTFKAGDVFTIEPGIYISTRALASLPDTPKNRAFIARVRAAVVKYENTAVRIEETILVHGQPKTTDWQRASTIVGGAGLLIRDGRPLTDWTREGLSRGFDTTRHPAP